MKNIEAPASVKACASAKASAARGRQARQHAKSAGKIPGASIDYSLLTIDYSLLILRHQSPGQFNHFLNAVFGQVAFFKFGEYVR
jgi:hypothetical protein